LIAFAVLVGCAIAQVCLSRNKFANYYFKKASRLADSEGDNATIGLNGTNNTTADASNADQAFEQPKQQA